MITVVYPYLDELSQGQELKQSIRSLCKNADFEFDIVIIGDVPKWYKGKSIKTKPIRGVNFARAFDIGKKLDIISKSDLITTDFVYMYDDIYLIDKVSLDDISGAIALEEQKEVAGSSKWRILLRNTYTILNKYYYEYWNYETHLPRVLNKAKLRCLVREFDLKNRPCLFNTLYFNFYYDKPRMILNKGNDLKASVYSWKDGKNYKEVIKGKKILNHTEQSYNQPDFRQYVDSIFTEKCQFEL